MEKGIGKLSLGHISQGTQRHLISGFGSRGVSLGLGFGPWGDFAVAVMNGSSIVGWDNFMGLNRTEHQVTSASLGIDFLAKLPGRLRLETTLMNGSLLPLSDFNQGVINDAL